MMPCMTAAQEASTPGAAWETRTPEEVGLSRAKLDALREVVGGRGCVVRHGYMVYTWGDQSKRGDVASACKPWYSHFLFKAIEGGKIASLDDPINALEPRLNDINADLGHKDRNITWRHLANQTSCYGVSEAPGTAYDYNDYQMALFWDMLFLKVYGVTYETVDEEVLRPLLTDPLQCQDNPTLMAFGIKDRAGRVAVSVRDFARFGLLYLRKGNWNGKQLISEEHARMAVTSPLPNAIPRTTGKEAEMIRGQRSLGSRDIPDDQCDHAGSYSWLWWTNGVDREGKRHWPDAPADTYGAFGHGGPRATVVIPSLDMMLSWNDAGIKGADMENQALGLLTEAAGGNGRAGRRAPRTRVSIVGGKWHINGAVTYPGAKAEGLLMNARMVNCVFEDLKRPEFDPDANSDEFIAHIADYVAHGIRAFTVNLQGGFPGYEGAVNSAFAADGSLRESYVGRVRRVIEACDEHGAVVILGCYYQRQDQALEDEEAVRAGVVNVVKWIKACGFTNVVLEIANEFDHNGFNHSLIKTPEGQVELIGLARKTAPDLLVSTSGLGHGRMANEVAQASDFILIHFNGVPLARIPECIAALKPLGKPVVCNEDTKEREAGAKAAELCVGNGASWGMMLQETNQHFPFSFEGVADDPVVYAKLRELTGPLA